MAGNNEAGFKGRAGLPDDNSEDDVAVLATEPQSSESSTARSHGPNARGIDRKRKSDCVAYQKLGIGQCSQPTLEYITASGRAGGSPVEDQGDQTESRSSNQGSMATVLEHERSDELEEGEILPEEQIVHGEEDQGSPGREAEKTKRILSEYRSLLQKLAQDQQAMEPQDRRRKTPLHVEAANRLKSLWRDSAKKRIGPVPGVEVGDKFQYRIEMHMIGLHGPIEAGIDFLKAEETDYGTSLAISIVVSGCYEDDIDNGDVLIFAGQGANDYDGNRKQIRDQTFDLGNSALLNNWRLKKPVRVIRGLKYLPSSCFRYDGLYDVQGYRRDTGQSGYVIYKSRLKRQPGQPPLQFHIVRFRGRSVGGTVRHENVIKQDIGEGLDKSRISVVNTVDGVCSMDDFEYLVTVKYPNWLRKGSFTEGCLCVEDCNDVKSCRCATRNGGEFPYTARGTLARTKPVVYECGPPCRCPPTCANRVAQRGIKTELEVFRTRTRDWGLRSLDFIEKGKFIVEYTGKLVADPDPASDDSIDRFIFPISCNPVQGSSVDLPGVRNDEAVSGLPGELGFKVDASRSGNASRFIGRSRRPNILAQYVLYDHHDARVPHVMLFAAENISPLIELKMSPPAKRSSNSRDTEAKRDGQVDSRDRHF